MGSLLDSIKSSISPEMVRSIASAAGESPESIKKGLETASATMLGSLASKSTDSGFLSQIMSLVSSYGTQTLGAAAGAGGTATAAASEAGSNFVNLLFGGNKAAVESKIAQASGLSSSSGATILASAAPLVLSTLSSKLGGGVSGLSSALTSELPDLRGMIPAGMPGIQLPNLAGAATAARGEVSEKAGGGWLWPVLLLGAVLIAGLVWYFNRTPEAAKPVESAAAATQSAATTATNAISDATKAAWAKLGELFKRKLPDGTELSIPKLGVENKLINWIESSAPVDKSTWFDFDRLLFDTGSATLEPASQEQLSNVAAIMKAYPKVKIKIGGYTDNTGDAAANLKLSDERAKNVMAELVKLGVEPSRMEAEGYGDTHAVADNNTEEGRQLNRRISLRVTEK
jgi:outer membrane protein OmpA-like peptidoglycan-associated protein